MEDIRLCFQVTSSSGLFHGLGIDQPLTVARIYAELKLPCPLCHETDHQSQSCACAPLIPPSTQPPASQWAPKRPHYASQQPSSQLPSRLPDGSQLCVSWNQGGCIAMGRCRYKHVCGSCREAHIARDCSQTPEDFIFKRQPKRPASFRPSI